MPNLTNANIAKLLRRFQPLFFFDPTEQFFPAAAEEVLGHQSTESWNKAVTHQRGTAVLMSASTATSYSAADVQAGVDDPNGAPLTFDAVMPSGIGQNFAFNSDDQDLFLDCAGWNDTVSEVQPGAAAYTTGSISYLSALFSGLGHAMNSGIPASDPAPAPKFSVPRLTSPTIYAEVDWAGLYPKIDQMRVDQHGGMPDFPPSVSVAGTPLPGPFVGLNDYLTLTYYLFYPAMELSPTAMPDLSADRLREGQWEAITVFIKGDPEFSLVDDAGRPDFPFTFVTGKSGQTLRGLTPKFLAYSTGYTLGDDNFNPLSAEVRPWPTLQTVATFPVKVVQGSHVMAYVSAGTHRNFYDIDATVTPGSSAGPDPALNTTGAAVMGAAGSVAGICAGIAGLPPAAIACIVVAAIVFLIGLILFILSFLLESSNPPTETPQSTQPDTDVARDDGPAAIPASTGVSAPLASSVIDPTLRLISAFSLDPTPPITAYPLPTPLPQAPIEKPSWWNYPGRWGVRVTPQAAGQWDSGGRRTDPFGRTRAYWNSYQLVQFIAANGGTFSL